MEKINYTRLERSENKEHLKARLVELDSIVQMVASEFYRFEYVLYSQEAYNMLTLAPKDRAKRLIEKRTSIRKKQEVLRKVLRDLGERRKTIVNSLRKQNIF